MYGTVAALEAMMLLVVLDMFTQSDVRTLMGGDAAPLGNTTVGQFCDVLEEALRRLTTPGSRVYIPEQNRQEFWDALGKSLSGG